MSATPPTGASRHGLPSLHQADWQAGLRRLVGFNPSVTAHELRTRMRGTRVVWVILCYTFGAVGAFLLTLWMVALSASGNPGELGLRDPQLGRLVLGVLAYLQLCLILLILPAYGAGAITMERERRTIEMLRATLLSPSDVVTGKLLVVLALGLLLLITSLPVAAWSLVLGGVAPEEILRVYSYLFAMGLFVTSLGLFFSSWMGRSIRAVVATYASLLVLLVGGSISIALAIGINSSSPISHAFGRWGSGIVLGIGAAVCGWLLFLATRWVWQRLSAWPFRRTPARRSGGWGRRLGEVVALIVPVVVLYPLVRTTGPLFGPVARAPVFWLYVTVFPMALSGVLGGALKEFLSGGFPGGYPGPTSASLGVETMIWLVSVGSALVGSALLWALSIRAFRRAR